MSELTSVSFLKRIFRERGLAPNKKLGQSFLVDASVLRRIVDAIEVSTGDYILEIGPGVGTLTEPLAEKAGGVMAVEIDRGFFSFLEERFSRSHNVKLVHADILRCDIDSLFKSWLPSGSRVTKVVSNLPYCITTPVIEKCLRLRAPPEQLLFAVQKELAERLTAAPGSRIYGRITLLVNYLCHPEVLFTVGSGAFWPRPKVDSALVRFRMSGGPLFHVQDEDLFFAIIKKAFHQRRRMLRKSLASLVGEDCLYAAFERADVAATLRPERLSVGDFARLANAIYGLKRSYYE